MQATGDYRVDVFIFREWELSLELLVSNISARGKDFCHQIGIFYLFRCVVGKRASLLRGGKADIRFSTIKQAIRL
jgi:hypothetical protein